MESIAREWDGRTCTDDEGDGNLIDRLPFFSKNVFERANVRPFSFIGGNPIRGDKDEQFSLINLVSFIAQHLSQDRNQWGRTFGGHRKQDLQICCTSYVEHRFTIQEIHINTIGIKGAGDIDDNRDGSLQFIPYASKTNNEGNTHADILHRVNGCPDVFDDSSESDTENCEHAQSVTRIPIGALIDPESSQMKTIS